MPLPTIAGTVRCAVQGLATSGRKWTNVHHMRYSGGASSPGTVELDALDVELFRFYSGTAYTSGQAVMAACPAAVTITQIDYTVLDGMSLIYSKAHAVAGGGGASSLPSEVSMAVTLRTNIRGRRNRGRIYLPPMTPSNIGANGNWSSTLTTFIVNQYLGMMGALTPKQWAPVVASYGHSLINDPSDPHDKIEVNWTPYATNIVTPTIDAKPDVQRRRK